MPPAVEAQSPNHWTAREFPLHRILKGVPHKWMSGLNFKKKNKKEKEKKEGKKEGKGEKGGGGKRKGKNIWKIFKLN